MGDVWNTLAIDFANFDAMTYAIMAIIVVGAAFMMPSMAAIVTATCGGLFIFGFAVFLRTVIAAKNAPAVARENLDWGLTLPLQTILVYSAVFCFSIALVHTARMFSKE